MRELFLKRDGLLWMMFLRRYQQLQSSGILKTVTGTAPLTLDYALPKAIKSLIQYGECTQDDTPTSEDPVDIVCNNGTLVVVDNELPLGYKRIESIDFDGDFWYETGASLRGTDDVTLTLADTTSSGQNVFGSYNGTSSGTKNFSLYLYGGGSSSNCYFRYGEQLVRPRYGSGERTITFGESGTSGFTTDVTVTPDTFVTAANAYIGMLPNSTSPAFTGSIIGNILVSDRLKYIPCERTSDGVIGYYEAVNGEFIEPSGTGTPVKGDYDTSHCTQLIVDGTPEVLTITADGATTQTATVEDLFAVGDYKDEQDLITGVVTRRVAVCVYDGTQTIGNTFLSTTGGKDTGAIIVYPLDEPITEQVTAQPLSTSEGTNVVSVTAEVSDVSLEVQYKGEFVKTITGSVLHLTDALAKPAKKFIANLEPEKVVGKNLFNKNDYVKNVGYIDPANDRYVVGADRITAVLPDPIPVGTYTISRATSARLRVGLVTSTTLTNYQAVTNKVSGTNSSDSPVTITVSQSGYYLAIFFKDTADADEQYLLDHLQVEVGSSATSYEDYTCTFTGHTGAEVYHSGADTSNPTTIPITFPDAAGTVYGGALTFEDGAWKLLVGKKYMLLNDDTKWADQTGTIDIGYQTNATDRKTFDNSYDGFICSYAGINRSGSNTARWSGSTSTTFGFKGLGLTLEKVKEDALVNKISIVYELAEPTEYTLTEEQALTLLKGENNIWCDASDNLVLDYLAKAESTP